MASQKPVLHGADHLPGHADPIPGLTIGGGSSLAAALFMSGPDTSVTTGLFTPGGGEIFNTTYTTWTLSTTFGASGTFSVLGPNVVAADPADSFYMVGFQIGFGTPIPIAEAPYLEVFVLSGGGFYVMGYTDHKVADVNLGDIALLYATEFIAPTSTLSITANLQTVNPATDGLLMYVTRLGAFA